MGFRHLVAAAVAVGFALADSYKGENGANNYTTPTTREGDITIHYVTVGKATNVFQPNSIIAQPGDIVSFQFYPSNHSVIKAAYEYPCVPYDDVVVGGETFFSGFHFIPNLGGTLPTWNLTVNDTSPVFYYCGAPDSCVGWGMVGAINPNASQSIAMQIHLAKTADYMLLPGEPFPAEGIASLSSLAATATTATETATVTSTPTPTPPSISETAVTTSQHHSSGLSTGAIAGIAVGSAVGAIAIAGLFLLLWRNKSLKQDLNRQNASTPYRGWPDANNVNPAAFAANQSFATSNRHNSQLPAYQSVGLGMSDMPKPDDEDGFQGGDRGRTPERTSMSPQGRFTEQDQQYGSAHQAMAPQQLQRYTTHSELTGHTPPMVELDVPDQQIGGRFERYSR